jgi:hypothetical protein
MGGADGGGGDNGGSSAHGAFSTFIKKIPSSVMGTRDLELPDLADYTNLLTP